MLFNACLSWHSIVHNLFSPCLHTWRWAIFSQILLWSALESSGYAQLNPRGFWKMALSLSQHFWSQRPHANLCAFMGCGRWSRCLSFEWSTKDRRLAALCYMKLQPLISSCEMCKSPFYKLYKEIPSKQFLRYRICKFFFWSISSQLSCVACRLSLAFSDWWPRIQAWVMWTEMSCSSLLRHASFTASNTAKFSSNRALLYDWCVCKFTRLM